MSQNIAEFNDVYKKYGKKQVLEAFNLNIPKGKIVGLLGPNGSGKTTMIKLLNGLTQCDKGNVFINGLKPSVKTKEIVSYLPDRNYLNEDMTVKELLKLFSDFYKDFDINKAKEMIKNLNLEENEKIKSMSKGTKEKVGLILVMSRNAKLYILDEPIGGVDPASRAYIIKTILKNFNEDSTLLIATHLINEIENICDEVIIISKGEILLKGNVDEIREEKGMSIGKLLKYELKSTAKFFVPMYIAILAITTLNSIFIRKDVFIEAQGIINMVIGGLFIAITTLTIVIIVKRFKKNLLGDEGYLMFTLPVKSSSLILSKYISALIWVLLTIIVSSMAIIIYSNALFTDIGGLFGDGTIFSINSIMISGKQLVRNNQDIIIIASVVGLTLSAISIVIFVIYNSIAIAQLPIFTKHKTVVSIIAFFVIGKIISVIYDFVNNFTPQINISSLEFIQAFTKVTTIGILENIFIVIILFISLNYTLSKKLNLD